MRTASERHNKELAQKSTDAAKSAFASLGVLAEIMRAASLGESALLIDTQGPEARNRRVEVNIFSVAFSPSCLRNRTCRRCRAKLRRRFSHRPYCLASQCHTQRKRHLST
jgi:hypothetical protein